MKLHAADEDWIWADNHWPEDKEEGEDIQQVLRCKVGIDVVGWQQGQCNLVIDNAEELPNVVQVL